VRHKRLQHSFVQFIPEVLEDGVIYISVEYRTVTHRCCCGCGREVVTPLTPTDWRLIYDGRSISLEPSIGNWSIPCRSHYWIRNNAVVCAPRWSAEEIEAGRLRTRSRRVDSATAEEIPERSSATSRWQRVKGFLRL
jgi:hypothetical protein